jgi:Glu-tRNA(Gln) amidotransferase subunit E-like FAD-binding protein
MQLYIDKLSGTLTKVTEYFTKGRLETEKMSEEQLSKLHRDFQEERIKRHMLDQTLQLLQQQQNKEHGADLLELLALSRSLP